MGFIITLILIGILLLAIELLITPGVGVAGILGLLSVIGAVLLAFGRDNTTGIITLALVAILLGSSLWLFLRSKTWEKISLKESIDSKSDHLPAQKGIEIGSRGVALSRLGPAGVAKFGAETANVWTQSGIIDNGTPIEVTDIENSKIIVKKI
ncbi:MAG: NfeD family protein [Bacteroidales bacterium]